MWIEGGDDDGRGSGDLVFRGGLVGKFGAKGASDHEIGHGAQDVQLGGCRSIEASLLLCVPHGHNRDRFQFAAEADSTLDGSIHNGRVLAYRQLAATTDGWIHVQVAQLLEVRDAKQ